MVETLVMKVYSYECWIDTRDDKRVFTQVFHLRWMSGQEEWEDRWVTMEGECVGVLFEKRLPWWRFW